MSPLTKGFVVIVTVLSILLVALVVPFVAKTQDYKTLVSQREAEARAAEQRARAAQAEISALQSTESERNVGLNAQVNQLAASNTELRGALAKTQDEVTGLTQELAARDANLGRFAAADQQKAQLLEAITAELNTNRAKLVDQQTQLIELIDRNNELNAQLDGLTRQVRRFKEKSAEAAERVRQLEERIRTLPEEYQQVMLVDAPDTDAAIGSAVPIVGRVKHVRDAGGLTLVEVDVGISDGVEKNMEFLVHRGDHFVGTLVILEVDASDAAGKMDLVEDVIQPGDSIYAGPL